MKATFPPASATDNYSAPAAITLSYSASSGSTFPVDTTPPTIACPADQIAETTRGPACARRRGHGRGRADNSSFDRSTPRVHECRPCRVGAMAPGDRDYSTISPSAKALLIMKSETTIPFAREAAELIWGAEGVVRARASMNEEPLADLRRLHVEDRYRSVDALLEDEKATRILEIAGGLSFRGLALASTRSEISYLDTDLPEIAGIKADLVAKLHPGALAG